MSETGILQTFKNAQSVCMKVSYTVLSLRQNCFGHLDAAEPTLAHWSKLSSAPTRDMYRVAINMLFKSIYLKVCI